MRSAENTSSVVQTVLVSLCPADEGVNSMRRDFCSGYDCESQVFVAPWWSNSLLSGFCACPCPLVFTRMFTWRSAGLFTAVISQTNSKEAEKRVSFHNSDKHRGRTVMLATSWLVDAFFLVSFMSKHVHLKTEQELILYRVFKSLFPSLFLKKR